MSKVIVGFDFSKGSAYAVDLAIDVANKFQQDLCLVYVKEKDQDEGPIREEIERRNAGVAHLLNGIKMDYVIREGKVSRELCEQAREDNAFLIVVGTHGMSGFEKNWIGRNTYRTIAEAPAPVLTIREDFNIHKSVRNWLQRPTSPRHSTPSCTYWVYTLLKTSRSGPLWTPM